MPLNSGDKMGGFVAQSLSGQRPTFPVQSWTYQAAGKGVNGSYTFTAPESGWYRFVLWGSGGGFGANSGGGGGALVIADRYLSLGQTVSLVVGAGNSSSNLVNTTATFPSGEVLTAGGGAGGAVSSAGGIATCNTAVGDIGVNGPAGSSSLTGGGVAGASSGNYSGGYAAPLNDLVGGFPGGGNPGCSTGSSMAAHGLVVVHRTRMRQ